MALCATLPRAIGDRHLERAAVLGQHADLAPVDLATAGACSDQQILLRAELVDDWSELVFQLGPQAVAEIGGELRQLAVSVTELRRTSCWPVGPGSARARRSTACPDGDWQCHTPWG